MQTFNCVNLTYDEDLGALTWAIKDTGMPNFCYKGLQEFRVFSKWLQEYFSNPEKPLRYLISVSEYKGMYNMGGDLPFFLKCIRSGNFEELKHYAHLCVDAIYDIYTSFNMPAISIALVEGNAYGGGFECALAHDYIIAQKDAQFCLPERKFNLFPGMGAYSLLHRKLSPFDANFLLKKDSVFKANNLQGLGLIETVFDDSSLGTKTLHEFIKTLHENYVYEYHHIRSKKAIYNISKKELLNITNIWIDACKQISEFDLRKMEILAKAQSRKVSVAY